MLARYASFPERSRGRRVPEAMGDHRTVFQRDRDRIIHSTAFRRLKHKTQVFVAHEGDHFRTRLTHTIEVAQVARTIAKELSLNEELTEAVALAHDLGHTPFGHVGEDALALAMKDYGGFDHNAQAIKIVTQLEHRYAAFDGLNLSWEALEGIAKHNGPVEGDVPYALAEYNAIDNLELATHASAEAQVAALSDDIAYNNHDLDDGLRADLFSVEAACELPIIGPSFAAVDAQHPDLDPRRRRHEALRRVYGVLVGDLIGHSSALLADKTSVDDVRNAGHQCVGFSQQTEQDLKEISAFLYKNMYRSDPITEMRKDAGRIVTEMFATFMHNPELLPETWDIDRLNEVARARKISDYISGMTDNFATEVHSRICPEKA